MYCIGRVNKYIGSLDSVPGKEVYYTVHLGGPPIRGFTVEYYNRSTIPIHTLT